MEWQTENERERCRHDNWQRKSKREGPLEVRATVSPLRHAPALSLNDADGWLDRMFPPGHMNIYEHGRWGERGGGCKVGPRLIMSSLMKSMKYQTESHRKLFPTNRVL